MRFDLTTPCKNCPFRNDETRITFSCRERAEEIEESAYRNGFPCHLSAVLEEDEDESGFIAGPNTQHCVGYIIMQLKSGSTEWPGIGNDDELGEKLAQQVDWNAPVFENEDEFLDANEGRQGNG